MLQNSFALPPPLPKVKQPKQPPRGARVARVMSVDTNCAPRRSRSTFWGTSTTVGRRDQGGPTDRDLPPRRGLRPNLNKKRRIAGQICPHKLTKVPTTQNYLRARTCTCVHKEIIQYTERKSWVSCPKIACWLQKQLFSVFFFFLTGCDSQWFKD